MTILVTRLYVASEKRESPKMSFEQNVYYSNLLKIVANIIEMANKIAFLTNNCYNINQILYAII